MKNSMNEITINKKTLRILHLLLNIILIVSSTLQLGTSLNSNKIVINKLKGLFCTLVSNWHTYMS